MAMGRLIACGCLMDLFWVLAVVVGRSSMAIRRGSDMPEEVARRRARNWSWTGFGKVMPQRVESEEMFEKVAWAAGMDQRERGCLRPVPWMIISPPFGEMAAGLL